MGGDRTVKVRLFIYLCITAAVIVGGTVGFALIEGHSFMDAFYFTMVTIATVGYGDISPATTAGKALCLVLIISGVGAFLGVIANTTELFLSRHESKLRKDKLNVLISLFFTQYGASAMEKLIAFNTNTENFCEALIIDDNWSDTEFHKAIQTVKVIPFQADATRSDITSLKESLVKAGDIIIRLMENPTLMEHESFTDMLRALSHLRDELISRPTLQELPGNDYAHLSGDINRIIRLILIIWLEYMMHLKKNYPYLFSHAVRTNPFDPNASVIIE